MSEFRVYRSFYASRHHYLSYEYQKLSQVYVSIEWTRRTIKKVILIASSSLIKIDSPRGVDGYADTNQTKLNARSHHTYEVWLLNASHLWNSNRYGEILENVSPKSRDVIGRFPRGRGTCIVWFSVEPTNLDHSNIFISIVYNWISFDMRRVMR